MWCFLWVRLFRVTNLPLSDLTCSGGCWAVWFTCWVGLLHCVLLKICCVEDTISLSVCRHYFLHCIAFVLHAPFFLCTYDRRWSAVLGVFSGVLCKFYPRQYYRIVCGIYHNPHVTSLFQVHYVNVRAEVSTLCHPVCGHSVFDAFADKLGSGGWGKMAPCRWASFFIRSYFNHFRLITVIMFIARAANAYDIITWFQASRLL